MAQRQTRTGARKNEASPPREPDPTDGRSLPPEEQENLPRWLPVAVFAAVTLFLFRDFVFSAAMLYGGDTEAMGYMARAFYAEQLASGNFPGWNPLLLGGTPFLASLAGGDSLYPPSVLLLLIMEPYRALGWKLVLHVFLAGVGMYGWSRTLGASRGASMVAGLGFLVAPFLVTLVYPGHDGKLFVTALAPFLFWAVERWYRGRSGMAWAGIAATVALVILTTHFQMAYFLFGAVGAYALFRTVQEFRGTAARDTGPDAPAAGIGAGADAPGGEGEGASAGRSGGLAALRQRAARLARGPVAGFALFLAASVTGAGVAGVQLLPAVNYITDFSRRTATTTQASPEENRAYGASWSLHPEEVAGLVIPEFVGSDAGGSSWTTGTYWGRNPFKLNHEYVGVGILVLALLAFLGGPRAGVRRFLLGMGLVALLYALGANTPVWGLFFGVVPGISLFRAPSMAIFLTGLAACTLAAFGTDQLLRWVRDPQARRAGEGQKVLWIATGVLGGLMLLVGSGALSGLWDALFGTLEAPRAGARERALPFMTRGALFGTLICAALAGALQLGRRKVLGPTLVLATLAFLVTVDGARVDGPFIQTRDFRQFYQAGPNIQALQQLQATEPPFRVLDLSEPAPGQGVRAAMHGLEIASGHHPNDLARYRELTGMVGGGMPQNLLQSANLMALLNVRYIIWPTRQFGPAQGLEPVSATQMGDGQIFEAVYEVDALARARLVSQVEVVPDEQAVARLMEPSFDVTTTVTSPQALDPELGGGIPAGDVTWVEKTTDRRILQVDSDRPALLVLAENWYPAWHATVDGEEAPVLRVNHTLQAVPVPAGTSEVELRFRSGTVRGGLTLSLAGLLLLVGVAGASYTGRAGA